MISSPSLSMKIQIMGGKVFEDWGFKFFTQNCVSFIFATYRYLVWLIRNQIKHVENDGFYWCMICKTRCSKMFKNKGMQFFMENLKMKRKKEQKILTFRNGDFYHRFWVISCPWFEFSCELRSSKSNQNKFLKEIRLYCDCVPTVKNFPNFIFRDTKKFFSSSSRYGLGRICHDNCGLLYC